MITSSLVENRGLTETLNCRFLTVGAEEVSYELKALWGDPTKNARGLKGYILEGRGIVGVLSIVLLLPFNMKFGKQQYLRRDKSFVGSYVDLSSLKSYLKYCANYVHPLENEEKTEREDFIISSGSFTDLGTPQVQAHLPDRVIGGGLLQHMEFLSMSENESQSAAHSPEILRKLPSRLSKTFKEKLIEEAKKANKRFEEERLQIILLAEDLKKDFQHLSQKQIEANLQELRLKIQDLFDYSHLQEDAFFKILKKWDKRVGSSELTRDSFFKEVLDQQPFIQCDVEAALRTCQEIMLSLASRRPPSQFIVDLSKPIQDKRTTKDSLDIENLQPSKVHRFWVTMNDDAFTRKLKVPVIVAKGACAGQTMCVTACLHGNELNGIPVVHKMVHDIDPQHLVGNLVAIPIVNGPGYLQNIRGFSDNADLNRCFPGNPTGNRSLQYAHCFIEKIVKHVDYLVDLHTASHGRANSLYVRADMNDRMCKRFAHLQNPTIIVHNSSPGGSLRGAAQELNIPAITVEIGDCSKFQESFFSDALSFFLLFSC
ncbi:uncharacterized protein LOC135145410 [Zophobas morio]|uniref:uncharacterized protein LOC135145410 n=1 Tax=Zophobas morio TaxID=2755281 RepID=UPI0030831B53